MHQLFNDYKLLIVIRTRVVLRISQAVFPRFRARFLSNTLIGYKAANILQFIYYRTRYDLSVTNAAQLHRLS